MAILGLLLLLIVGLIYLGVIAEYGAILWLGIRDLRRAAELDHAHHPELTIEQFLAQRRELHDCAGWTLGAVGVVVAVRLILFWRHVQTVIPIAVSAGQSFLTGLLILSPLLIIFIVFVLGVCNLVRSSQRRPHPAGDHRFDWQDDDRRRYQRFAGIGLALSPLLGFVGLVGIGFLSSAHGDPSSTATGAVMAIGGFGLFVVVALVSLGYAIRGRSLR
jgi:hypothetical protein